MQELFYSLQGLGFSDLEIKIYLALLDYGAMSPYQLAKKIDISRSSIYNALEHMMSKSMVEVIPEETVMYLAENPAVLLSKLEGNYKQNLKIAKAGLEQFLDTQYEEKSALINGFEIIIEKAKYMINHAKEEVFINTDIDLNIMYDELCEAVKRGVRIVVFSFVELMVDSEGVEIFSHNRKRTSDNTNNRLMIVADDMMAMIADAYNGRGNWSGTVTNNNLMKKVVREHIHNDIYMLKLRDVYGKEIYDKIHINTKQEKKSF